mgnify:CR=1 FL=1
MKKGLLMILMLVGIFAVKAQEEESFTDEDLTKYATVMVWAETEKDNLGKLVSDSVSIWIEGTDLETSKYIEISKADKKGELETVEASEGELAVYKEVQTKIDNKTSTFKEVYVTKIKEDIGAGLYNKLKKALKADDEVKVRYDAIYAELQSADEAESKDTEE